MNRALGLVTFSAALMLSGCGAGVVNPVTNGPTTVTNPVTTPAAEGLGVQDYGGHAPLVGAHVYLVQLGAPTSTVTQTYGSVVKSLLTIDGKYTSTPVYSGTPALPYTYPRTKNGSWTNSGNASDQFVPSTDLVGQPFYGVTTNQFGESYITGDYLCDAGYPVMLIGYGGYPSYYGAGPNTVNVTSGVIYNGTVGGVAGGIITYTTSSQLFYTGESISTTITGANSYYSVTTGSGSAFSGSATSGVLSGGEISGYTGPAGTQYLTSTQFSVFVPGYGGGTGSPGTVTGTVTGTPAFNPAATNMAMLGLCPASGNFSTSGNGALNYIYMNEVSTTAAAYALAQFTNQLATGQSGYDEFHIGAPVGNKTGLQNAAITAGLLYDIQGGNTATTGGFDGENHTARTVTPGSATGTVPNQQINMIANSLAACVDSANTYYWNGTYVAPSGGNQSTACKTLGQYAQDNGYVDLTAPTHNAFNIAQAAFSLARFPQGLGTATTSGGTNGGTQTLTAGTATTASNLVSTILNLPAGSNTPFLPAVSSANDLSIAIQWNPGYAVTDVEIDANGNAWAMGGAATNAGTGSTNLYELLPSTSVSGTTLGGMNSFSYLAASGLSTALTAGLAIDASNNAWVPGATGIYKFTPGNGAGTQFGGSNSSNGGAISLDSSVNQYIPSGNDGAPLVGINSSITKQNTGTPAVVATGYPIAATSTTCANSVGWTTLDSAGNLWTSTSQNNTNAGATVNYVCRFPNSGGTTPQFSFALPNGVAGQAGAQSAVTGGFSIARGLATDMNDNVWFAEKNQDALYVVAKGATSGTPTSNTRHGQLSAPRGVAVDGANTIWVANTGDTTATVLVGAVPTSSPKYGTGLVQFSSSDVPITPNYITGDPTAPTATTKTNLASVAIDPSGNIWSAQGSQTPGNTGTVNPTLIFEYVGLGAPTTTPILVAKANGKTGIRPGFPAGQVTVYNIGNVAANVFQGYIPAGAPFYVGETVTLSGFATSTFLNGVTFTISTVGVGGPGLFTANYTHANVGVTNETGNAAASN
jgi:hypothetical protein